MPSLDCLWNLLLGTDRTCATASSGPPARSPAFDDEPGLDVVGIHGLRHNLIGGC